MFKSYNTKLIRYTHGVCIEDTLSCLYEYIFFLQFVEISTRQVNLIFFRKKNVCFSISLFCQPFVYNNIIYEVCSERNVSCLFSQKFTTDTGKHNNIGQNKFSAISIISQNFFSNNLHGLRIVQNHSKHGLSFTIPVTTAKLHDPLLNCAHIHYLVSINVQPTSMNLVFLHMEKFSDLCSVSIFMLNTIFQPTTQLLSVRSHLLTTPPPKNKKF